LWISFALSPIAHKNTHITGRCSLVVHCSSAVAILTTETSSERAHAHLLPRLLWSWTVLLPSDTRRKPITSITSVLLPFVTYVLTLPCSSCVRCCSCMRSQLISGEQYWLFCLCGFHQSTMMEVERF
jgi:hypothetical protein